MRRNIVFSLMMLSAFLTAALSGCGSGNKGGADFPIAQATRIDNTNCTNACHAASLDLVTGKGIVFQWNTSAHVKGAFGLKQLVDCQDCHGPGSLHWGIGPIPFPDPDAAGVCLNAACHSNSASAALKPVAAHFSSPPNASFITSQSLCRDCHDPHDNRTAFPVNLDWSGSAHAAISDPPFAEPGEDFKTFNTCNRCHTTTGFVNFLASKNLSQPAWGVASDPTKEVITCKACHVDYSWKRRTAITGTIPAGSPGAGTTGVQLPYPVNPGTLVNQNTPGVFTNSTTLNRFYVIPTAGESDLCNNCHSFRKSGRNVVLTSITDSTAFSAVRQHYLGAAGTMYTLAGYEFLAHANYILSPHAPTLLSASKGPCVDCHLWTDPTQSRFPRHTLDPAVVNDSTIAPVDINGTVASIPASAKVCSVCHGVGLPFDGTAATLNTLKVQYANRIAALQAALQALGIFYDSTTDPYFFDSATVATRKPFTKWVTAAAAINAAHAGATVTSNQVIGAAFNLQLCVKEPGGYVHNPFYTGELLYDSLNLLTNGSAALTNPNPNATLFPAGRP